MIARLFLISMIFVGIATSARAQCPPRCYSCTDSCGQRQGYSSSPQYPFCGLKDCGIVAPAFGTYLDSPHPGLFTAIGSRGLVVTTVVPHSPAENAGILEGDEILSLNGENPLLACDHNWLSKEHPTYADLVIAHGARHSAVRLTLVPVRQLLSKSWLSRSNQLDVADHESSPVADSLWLFGFKWKQHAARFLQVTDVLQRSPADRAGLTIGDRIVGLNSTEIYRMGAVAVESLLTAKYPTHLRLTILQSGSPREVELSSVGVSWILRAAATSKRRERPNVVVASADF